MSENNQKIVIISQKSAVIGFVLSVFIGMFGIDRLYKGDKLLALLKFICAIAFLFVGWVTIWK